MIAETSRKNMIHFLKKVSYQIINVDGLKIRYQYDGKDDAQSFFFSMD